MLVLGTPELAHRVLHSAPGTYLAGAANRRILPVLPRGTLLTLDGDEHLARRRELTPLFHGESLDAVTPIIRDLTSRELDAWPVSRAFSVLPRMRQLTLRIAALMILGIEDDNAVHRLESCLADALRPYPMLAGYETLARMGPASPQVAAERRRKAFARCLAAAAPAESGQGALGPDEVFELLLAGHETTATALAWAIYELARSPEVAGAVAREPAAEDRPWLHALIHETLRLHPPLIDIVRRPAETLQLAGFDVSAGTLLMIPPPLIHRCDGCAEPARFRPDPFLRRRPDPSTWIPFGGGARRCLGAALAMLELREVLPAIAKRFRLRPGRRDPERASLFGTAIGPHRGAQIVVSRR